MNIIKSIVMIFFGGESHRENKIGKSELRTERLKGTSP